MSDFEALMHDEPFEFDDAPRSRSRGFSPLRILIALLVVGVGIVGVRTWFEKAVDAGAEYPTTQAWDAPYVDVTVTPQFAFESPGEAVGEIVLAFVVADHGDPCAPTWGGVFDLDTAAGSLDLDRRIARLRQTSRDVVVSFGGAINDELAVACTDGDLLTNAYREVISRYEVTTIDFDIEGEALLDEAAHARRAAAIAEVQQDRRDAGQELAIWLTIPGTESGLTAEGISLVDATLAGGVDLAGVNLMTMNFGTPEASESLMPSIESAAEAVAVQVLGSWRRAGLAITPIETWARIGLTPMVGRNDVTTEVFTLDDASTLVTFVQGRGIARLGYWSLNRDLPCGANEEPIAGVSNQCSHVSQTAGAFSEAFVPISGSAASSAGGSPLWAATVLLDDDPNLSPYPIWRSDGTYVAGEKTVLNGYVYEAKWWTQGDNPEAAVANAWETPWRIVGPVLLGDLVEPVYVAAGVVDAWDGETIYYESDQVWLDGSVYEAKWWNEGFQPNRSDVVAETHPWSELDPELFVPSND